MKVALAQIDSVAGDVQKNLDKHLDFIQQAVQVDVDLVIFSRTQPNG